MKLKDLSKAINQNAAFSLQEDYDNSGIITGNPESEASGALICLDVTDEVIDEAISNKLNVIISHHPLIFNSLLKITGQNNVEKCIIKAIKHDISIIAAHTNLDNYYYGVNNMLAVSLGLQNLNILSPKKNLLKKLVVFCPNNHADKVREAMFSAGAGEIGDYDSCSYNLVGKGSFRGSDSTNPFVGKKGQLHFESEVRIETIVPGYLLNKVLNSMISAHPYEEVAYDIYPLDNDFDRAGAGMIGELEKPLNNKEFLNLIKNKLHIPYIRHSEHVSKTIKKVAVCGGSGSFLLNKAIQKNADAFITSDIKYNMFLEARNQLLLIDAGHFETEQFTSKVIYDIVSKNFTNFALQISKKQINAVNYY